MQVNILYMDPMGYGNHPHDHHYRIGYLDIYIPKFEVFLGPIQHGLGLARSTPVTGIR